MRIRRIRFATTVATAVLVSMAGLSACGSDDEDDSSAGDSSTTSAQPSETVSDDAAEAPDELGGDEASETGDAEAEGTSDGTTPDWAQPVTTPGDLLTTAKAGDVTVKIYQVGIEKAPKDGMFVDPDTKEPILKEGDKLVFVNYVVTNNGDPIDLGSSLVNISARYDDWKWMQGMDSSSDDALYESQGVNTDSLAQGGFNDLGIYPFGTGQTYSVGDNFAYQKNSPITFDMVITPVDAKGDLIHDDRIEAEAKTTIK